jgi:hypothetical protein
LHKYLIDTKRCEKGLNNEMIKDRTKMETKDSCKMVTSSVADPDHFDTDPDSSVHFDRIRIRLYDTDLDPYRFKEVMYVKRYFLVILT